MTGGHWYDSTTKHDDADSRCAKLPDRVWFVLLVLLAVAIAVTCLWTADKPQLPLTDGSAPSLPLSSFHTALPSEARTADMSRPNIAASTDGMDGSSTVTPVDRHERKIQDQKQQEQSDHSSQHTFSALSTDDDGDNVGCVLATDNRQSQQNTDPYDWTVYMQTRWGASGEITNDGTGFVVRSLVPPPYVAILTAGHNILEVKTGDAPYSIGLWRMGPNGLINTTIATSDLSTGCAWSASEGWTALPIPKDTTSQMLMGVDWGYLICNTVLFPDGMFPDGGFGLLSDNSVYDLLRDTPVPAIHAGYPDDLMTLPPTEEEVWSVITRPIALLVLR